MKTETSDRIARLAGFALTIVLAGGAIATAVAAEIPTGKGGATLLMKAQPAASGQARTAMSCPTCKDDYLTRKDMSARGAVKPIVQIERHLCQGCDTKMATMGTGKAKKTVALHQCTSNGAAEVACCDVQ